VIPLGYKPIVLHAKKDDLGTSEKRRDGDSGPGIACGMLKCEEYEKKMGGSDVKFQPEKNSSDEASSKEGKSSKEDKSNAD